MKNEIKGMEFRLALEDAGHKICSALGLKPVSFVWSNHATTAGINSSGEIYLPNVDDDHVVNRATFDRYSGYLLHELLHRKYTSFGVMHMAGSVYLRHLLNAVEDIWIERQCIASGLVGNAEGLLTTLINGVIDENGPPSDWSDPAAYPFALACYGRRYAKAVPIADGLKPIFDEASRRIDMSTSTEQNLDIAKWVMDQLNNLPEDTPQTPQKGSGGEQPDGQGDGVGDEEKTAGKASKPDGVSVDPEVRIKQVCKSKTGTFDRNGFITSIDSHLQSHRTPLSTALSGKLAYEVKRLFANTGFEDFTLNQRKGRLNVSALHKLGNDDRLFKRRREVSGIDSAVTVCVDVSGSMEPIIDVVAAVAYHLVHTLEKAGVKTSILTFGSEVAVLKSFASHSVKRHVDTLERLKDGGGTNDYYAIRIAHEELFKRPEARKVCFVITDGVGDTNSARHQIKAGNALGITTIGVGVMEDVSRVYGNSVTVNSVADLGATTFKQIKLAA